MSENTSPIPYLEAYYETHDEDARLMSRCGQVEFLTTMRYIERYLQPGMRILEIGAAACRCTQLAIELTSSCRVGSAWGWAAARLHGTARGGRAALRGHGAQRAHRDA